MREMRRSRERRLLAGWRMRICQRSAILYLKVIKGADMYMGPELQIGRLVRVTCSSWAGVRASVHWLLPTGTLHRVVGYTSSCSCGRVWCRMGDHARVGCWQEARLAHTLQVRSPQRCILSFAGQRRRLCPPGLSNSINITIIK